MKQLPLRLDRESAKIRAATLSAGLVHVPILSSSTTANKPMISHLLQVRRLSVAKARHFIMELLRFANSH
jgi:hypothetical protein